jgi:hypothetical protein
MPYGNPKHSDAFFAAGSDHSKLNEFLARSVSRGRIMMRAFAYINMVALENREYSREWCRAPIRILLTNALESAKYLASGC